ncbi:hypothetical protein ACHAXR_003229 [Thalassiosira sp. AJA248-18]
MANLKQKNNSRLFMDPCYPKIDKSTFNGGADWKQFYGYGDAPKPLGRDVDIRLFVDLTQRSRTDFMVFINMSLIQWLSKRQPTLETSVFGAEFVAMKHGIESVRGLRYISCA